ncbi:hypothetical protein V6N11_049393 [Hibiscus sabdariffa]|uniref:Uncharacterized protein n=1 Tax=Hibiscus sabdariffa TaxID=183260 RepID=A0ABR1ZZZ5_9ROSI
MKSSREDSLDWLRSFQAPTSNLVLSSDSDSDSLPNDDQTPSRKKKIDVFEKHRDSESPRKKRVKNVTDDAKVTGMILDFYCKI